MCSIFTTNGLPEGDALWCLRQTRGTHRQRRKPRLLSLAWLAARLLPPGSLSLRACPVRLPLHNLCRCLSLAGAVESTRLFTLVDSSSSLSAQTGGWRESGEGEGGRGGGESERGEGGWRGGGEGRGERERGGKGRTQLRNPNTVGLKDVA